MTSAPTGERSLAIRLAALSVGQVVSWGILYYALIVAAPVIAGDTGWSLPSITLAFSAGLVARTSPVKQATMKTAAERIRSF